MRVVDYLVLFGAVTKLNQQSDPETTKTLKQFGMDNPKGFLKRIGFDLDTLGLEENEIEEFLAEIDGAADAVIEGGLVDKLKAGEPIDELVSTAATQVIESLPEDE